MSKLRHRGETGSGPSRAGVSPKNTDTHEALSRPAWQSTTSYGATKRPRLVARIAEAGSVAGRGCSTSPRDMPDALHFLVLTVAGWANRPQEDQIASLREELTGPPGRLAWRLGRTRRVPVVGRVGPPRRRVCHDRRLGPYGGPGRAQRRTGRRCLAPVAGWRACRALTRWCVARGGGAVRGAGRRCRPCGAADGLAPLCVLRQIRNELVAGVEQFLLVDDVVTVEDGAAFVAGQEHRVCVSNSQFSR